jgi:hypothetical protein
MAEVYNPKEYRNYIQYGKMDYLYDKVETYDYLKDIIQGKKFGWIDIQTGLKISNIICCIFLDNHDEQRLAGEALQERSEKGKPLMVIVQQFYFANGDLFRSKLVKLQLDSGFGTKTRTSILIMLAYQTTKNG